MEIVEISIMEKLPPELKIKDIRNNIKKILSFTSNFPSYEISLLLTNDSTIGKLNFAKRNIDKPTDVLSFPMSDKKIILPHQVLGEIIISLETAKFQARKIRHSFKEEFYRLLVHGILHLLGYDHEHNKVDARLMRKKEDECLALIFKNKCL